ncbi:hypothetical protein V2J09_016354 [Rumex salicifolius]
MEEYPEELRTPPVTLIALVGCPEIHQMMSVHLHSEQPPINTLALPDFTKISVMEKKTKDSAVDSPPAGIIKRDWLIKHRTRIPAVVAALFSSDHVSGGPTEWLQLCTHLDQLKAVIHARNTKLVIIVVHSTSKDDIFEDRMIALRKRAEVDSKHIISLLGSTFAELAGMYYRDEGQRVKTRLEKKNFSSIELAIRYCFKVSVYAEFRRDWVEALKLPAIQRLAEIKVVAEQVHFKLSTLLLHGGKIVEAVMWFQQHCKYYKKLLGSPDVTFMNWEWTSRQFLVFAELLEASSKTVPGFPSLVSASMDKALTEWELQPAYYYQLASHYLKEKRSYLELAVSLLDTTNDDNAMADSVVPSAYVGQVAQIVEEKDDLDTMQPLTDEEFTHYAIVEGQRFQDSLEIIALLKKSFDIYSNLKAVRMASYCALNIAKEYFSAGDTKKSKEFFDSAISFYRHEGWVTLLWEALGYLRECSRRDGSVKKFVEYSLEMAALPILSGESIHSFDYREAGPAGPPSYEQRRLILKEILSVASAEPNSSANKKESDLQVTKEAPLHLEIDVVSPLRVALLAAAAFHEQKVKPGTSMPFTLSMMSQLPLPLGIDAIEIQFNQSNCNFTVLNADKSPSSKDLNVQPGYHSETAVLTLIPNKWLRLTFDIKSEQSGKLECISIIMHIGSYLTICCRAESPASMGELPLWKFEERMESLPTKDPILAFLGQKAIQIDEPDPLVDLSINASGPALVGESFIVPVSITTRGHAVHSGELKINLVDTKGGGLVSPRETDSHSSEGHHVELVGVSGTDVNGKSLVDTDNAGKIQHSFGLVSVPFLSDGESWSCTLEIKWHRSKPVMLFVSLGYSPYSSEANSQQVHIHRSLEIEGKIPFLVTHRIMSPFRRDPLLLSRMKLTPDTNEKMSSLPLDEASILVVGVKNCTEVPLKLLSVSTLKDEDESEPSCTVSAASDGPARPDLLVPGEEYKKLFTVIPVGRSPIVKMGTLCLRWQRDSVPKNVNAGVLTKHILPDANAELSPLVLSLECPPHAILGDPFTYFIKIQNRTELLQEIKFSLVDSQSFVSSGSHSDAIFVLPKSTHILSYKLVPLSSGPQQLPRVTMTAIRYSAGFQPSIAASTIFVFPSKHQFKLETAIAAE